MRVPQEDRNWRNGHRKTHLMLTMFTFAYGVNRVQNEGYAMRCIAGATGSSDSETRLPTVFVACPQHDKPATYCSCKREEGDAKEGA